MVAATHIETEQVLIPITAQEMAGETIQTVDARKLHEFLEVRSSFKDWISRRIQDYDFKDQKDFCSFLSESSGGRPSKEYALTLDMAKELAMVERNDKGKQARQYFIECEKHLKGPPAIVPVQMLNDPVALRGLLSNYSEKLVALESKVAKLQPAQDQLQRIALADGTLCITNAAKTLQVRPKELFSLMSAEKWIYRRVGSGTWAAYQNKIQSGYLEHKVTEVTKPDGTAKITVQVLVTPKGLVKLAEFLEKPPVIQNMSSSYRLVSTQ